MTDLIIMAGPYRFEGRLETELAPQTCDYFLRQLPYRKKIVHVRWSGEGCWIPLGSEPMTFRAENATSYPAPGQFIFYPGEHSETEILLAYGGVRFAAKVGQLAGNHFLTLTQGLDQLPSLGKLVLWEGAHDISFELK